MSSSRSNRKEKDVMQLMKRGHRVKLINGKMDEFFLKFDGPTGSLYEGGVWKIQVYLSTSYPELAPLIRFCNLMYHPNVDREAGGVCLDALSEKWSPKFDLIHVFELFLPTLLFDPNPQSPFNREAAGLLLINHDEYKEKVKEYCMKYAKPEDVADMDESVGESEDKGDVNS